jgi:hypothetical protein
LEAGEAGCEVWVFELHQASRAVRRWLMATFDWVIGLRGFPEEQRKLLRPFFWIGFVSIWDLSGRLTRVRYEEAERRRKAYFKAKECETDWDRIGRDFRRIVPESPPREKS